MADLCPVCMQLVGCGEDVNAHVLACLEREEELASWSTPGVPKRISSVATVAADKPEEVPVHSVGNTGRNATTDQPGPTEEERSRECATTTAPASAATATPARLLRSCLKAPSPPLIAARMDEPPRPIATDRQQLRDLRKHKKRQQQHKKHNNQQDGDNEKASASKRRVQFNMELNTLHEYASCVQRAQRQSHGHKSAQHKSRRGNSFSAALSSFLSASGSSAKDSSESTTHDDENELHDDANEDSGTLDARNNTAGDDAIETMMSKRSFAQGTQWMLSTVSLVLVALLVVVTLSTQQSGFSEPSAIFPAAFPFASVL